MADKKLKNGEIGVTIKEEEIIWKDRKRTLFGLPLSFTVYKLSPSRIIVEKGFINKSIDEIRLYRVSDLKYSQSLGQRIFGLGCIELISSDASLPILKIERVKHADQVKEVISQAVEVSRRENGVRASELVGGAAAHGGPIPPAGAAVGGTMPNAGASLGPEMFPDFNHDGIDDRTQ